MRKSAAHPEAPKISADRSQRPSSLSPAPMSKCRLFGVIRIPTLSMIEVGSSVGPSALRIFPVNVATRSRSGRAVSARRISRKSGARMTSVFRTRTHGIPLETAFAIERLWPPVYPRFSRDGWTSSGTGEIFSKAANVARVPSSEALSTAEIARSPYVWAKRDGTSRSTSRDSLWVTRETRTPGVTRTP